MAQLAAPLHFHLRGKLESAKSNCICGAAEASPSSRDGKMSCPDRPDCVEVWGPDGTSKRFALGTRASFVVDRFIKKLVDAVKPVVCVEAFKHGEEPMEFGPDAPLLAKCEWDLRVVQEGPFERVRVCDKIPTASSRIWRMMVNSSATASTTL